MGKRSDAKGLQRLIDTGDPLLVGSFAGGLSQANPPTLTPEIEALVLRHYDDPRVGEKLRDFSPHYTSRALFDRYLATARAARQSNDPIFRQILRTDQAGIDADLLSLAPHYPAQAGSSQLLHFLGRRRYPGAVDALLAQMGAELATFGSSSSLFELEGYDSAPVWRKAGDEVERLKGAGQVSEAAYRSAHESIRPYIERPEQMLDFRRNLHASQKFKDQRKEALGAEEAEAEKLRADPPAYLAARAAYLGHSEAIAAQFDARSVHATLAGEYAVLGVYARFRARDLASAERYLRKAADGDSALGTVALADFYQFERGDRALAIPVYRHALALARQAQGDFNPFGALRWASVAFWQSWLAAEIDCLEKGTPFRGRITEREIEGFWEAQDNWRQDLEGAFPDWPPLQRVRRTASSAPGGLGDPRVAQWSEVQAVLARARTPQLQARLQALPPSRLTLIVVMRYVTSLPDASAMLAQFRRLDPSGYWTAIAFGTAAFHLANDPDDALRDGTADAMPGLAAGEKPPAIQVAAKRFLADTHLRTASIPPSRQ